MACPLSKPNVIFLFQNKEPTLHYDSWNQENRSSRIDWVVKEKLAERETPLLGINSFECA